MSDPLSERLAQLKADPGNTLYYKVRLHQIREQQQKELQKIHERQAEHDQEMRELHKKWERRDAIWRRAYLAMVSVLVIAWIVVVVWSLGR
jgi:Flp pilus assembly protein TadB